jgi:tetratricopeptide (TPR) repeat protein
MATEIPASSNAQLQEYLREVEKALRAHDTAGALRLSTEAVAKGHEHSHLLVLAAHQQLASGTLDRALELATRARALAPRNVDVLNVLGLSLARLNRGREAIPVFDAALRQSPGAFAVRFNRAWTLEQMSELKRARTEYERVLDQQPNHVEALVHLAHLAIQRRDLDIARNLAERALAEDATQAAAHLALANADLLDKTYDKALARLEDMARAAKTSPINRSIAQGLIGDSLEGLGRTSEAFAAWSASKETLRVFYLPVFEARGGEAARSRVLRLTEFFAAHPFPDWRNANDAYAGPVRDHVFLVGFPRSGTTLLEQVLASHTDVESMEERDCLVDALNAFVVPPDGLNQLAGIDEAGLSHYRECYWKRVADANVALKKNVFIDKMPLNSVPLCIIAKLFPHAKILFALRDPRDVVFSCFRRRFVMTPQMFELTTLEGAANYYDRVMRLCDTYRRSLALTFFETRHENLVKDFDSETQRLCDFIGIEWTDAMRNFSDRARSGVINTPSATQVARGLFTQGLGQWRSYADELAPVLPKLSPWVAHFGYPAN